MRINKATIALCVLGTFVSITGPRAASAQDTDAAIDTLAVADVRGGPEIYEGHPWLPGAVEELLAWRLERASAVCVVPTSRTHQARRELSAADPQNPIAWRTITKALGARRLLTAVCNGNADELRIALELVDLESGNVIAQTSVGPARLFAALDDATRWSLEQLGVTRLSEAEHQLVFAPPAESTSAIEYYVLALEHAREQRLRRAARAVETAISYDARCLPPLMLLAKLSLADAPTGLRLVIAALAKARESAKRLGDQRTLRDCELLHSMVSIAARSFDVARDRLERVRSEARAARMPFQELAALEQYADLVLSIPPPTGDNVTDADRLAHRKRALREAETLQRETLALLERLRDNIARVAANNKLALIYEQLEQPKQAEKYHKAAVTAAEKTGSRRNQATAWLFLAQHYRVQKAWDQAIEANRKCLEYTDDVARPRVLITFGDLLTEAGRPDEALRAYEESRATLLKTEEDLVSLLQVCEAIADLHHNAGRPAEARTRLTQALEYATVLDPAQAQRIQKKLDTWNK